jgi:hypothetical protein
MFEFCFKCNKSGEQKQSSKKAPLPTIDPVAAAHAAAKKKAFDAIDAGPLPGTEKKKAKKVWSTANPAPAAATAAAAAAVAASSMHTITLEYLCFHQNLIPERSRTYAAEDDGEEEA